jgi:hypothetical protein
MPAPITQGTALSGAQLRAGASVPGSFVYTPGPGTILPAGVHTLSLVFTPADAVNYTTVAASTNLAVIAVATTTTTTTTTTASATTATPSTTSTTTPTSTTPSSTPTTTPTGTATTSSPRITPIVTWPMPAPITQGTALSGAQLRAGASVPGTFAYDPPAGTILPAGVQTLSLVFTPADASRYTTAAAWATLAVNPGAFQVTVVRPAGGTVWAAGITCGTGGSDCDETLPTAVWLGLQATPDPGYAFVNWTGDCSGTSPGYALTVSGVRSCGAVFTSISGPG